MKVFITGGTGKLGKELVKIFPHSFHPTHKELDITDKEGVYRFIKENMPDMIVHCAALASVRRCEENKELAWKTNIEGSENLVKGCLKHVPSCYFVYISTACVFYGDKGDYTETDVPHPKNFYSLTKLIGEFTVKCLKNWLIIRTNFVPRERWPYPKAFVDRYGTYLFAEDVANAFKFLGQHFTGVLHVCGDKKISMYELAKITTPDVEPMTMEDYSGPPLTRDMSLRSERIAPFSSRYI